jgi:hypothetical protein
MTELSPQSQAILDAADEVFSNAGTTRQGLAAVLRAAADQLLAVEWEGQIPADTEHQLGINWARDALHVLANELEAH